jgi:hypothetical protein
VLHYDNGWNEILYVKDRSKVFTLCLLKYKVTNVYYYLDFMLRAASMLYVLPCKNLFVYEEGISAYRTDIFHKTANYKRKIRKLIGLSEYAGFHPRTKGIFVYDKEKYLKTFSKFKNENKLKPLAFNEPFQKMIDRNLGIALKIFEFDPDEILSPVINKRVLLYITAWPIHENIFKNISDSKYDYFIIKPHNHLRQLDFPKSWKNNKTIIIESVMLAEFLIKILIDRNNKIDIYHHNSSAVLYLDAHPNIQSVTRIKNSQQAVHSL